MGNDFLAGELLVDIGDHEGKTTPTSPHQPRVGHIISIEDTPLGDKSGDPLGLGLEDEEEDSYVLVRVSSGSDSDDRREFRPVRPAPPKPRPPKPPQQPRPYKTKSSLGKVGVSPPSGSGEVADTVPILSSKTAPPAKPPR